MPPPHQPQSAGPPAGPFPAPLAANRIQGSGTMSSCIRAFPWHNTPLGSIASWSETLLCSVNLMLASPFACSIYWGPQHILLYNDEYRAILHGKHPHALGAPGSTVWAEAWSSTGPPLARAFFRGESISERGVLIPILVNGVLRDRWWTYAMYPVFQGDTIVAVANKVLEDTSLVLARQAEAEILRVSAELNQILASTSDAIVTVDREWNLTYFNPRARQLYDPKGVLLGANLWEGFPAAAAAGSPFREHLHRTMEQGTAVSFESFYPEPLNFWIRLEAYPTPNGIVIFSRNVSDQKRAETALIKTEKLAAVGRLAASIAHEINNPLEAVTNLLYLARTSPALEEARDYLDTAETELHRVSVIANQTLRFYRQSTRPVPVLISDLVSGLLGIFHGRLLNSGVTVDRRDRPQKPVLCFDGEIRQVLSNFIGNALDTMRATGGTLCLRSREGTDWRTGRAGIRITVADTGEGMSSTTLAHLCEAFYTTKGVNGTGLGLWVSREIIDRHHGSLAVHSRQTPGSSGTVFALFLPFESVTEPSPAATL